MWAAALGRWINTSSAGNGPALPPPAVTLGLDPAHGWAWRPAPAIGPARARCRFPGRGDHQSGREGCANSTGPDTECRDARGGGAGPPHLTPATGSDSCRENGVKSVQNTVAPLSLQK